MVKKLTWRDIYKDFRKHYKILCKNVVYWHPRDYEQIVLYLEEGSKMVYDYKLKECWLLEDTWKD